MSTINYRELSLDTIWNLSWDNAKKYFLPIFVMNVLIYFCSDIISSMFYGTTELMLILQNAATGNTNPDLLAQQMVPVLIAMLPMVILGSIVGWLLSTYFKVALNRLLLDGVKGETLQIGERIRGAWTGYLSFLGITLLNSIIIGLGFALCLLPGIFLAVRLMFVPIIAANKPQLTLSEVFSESWNLTRGHFWTLIGYAIVMFLVNLVGIICCCVGVLFTEVITQFMVANIYYTLAHEEEEEVVAEEETIVVETEE